jgi:DNA (cytosine-5)-methyltransferase 1
MLKVVELFAGVGGFKLGLEGWMGKSATSGYMENLNSEIQVVWSNQWEPATKIQHASKIYEARFGSANHSNVDIAKVDVEDIPSHDVLCGGFPCQDYSVAKQLSKSTGIQGKKGVLWWEIHRILSHHKPKFVFLENVDRLLKSPSTQRGRDFAIMLASLSDLGYSVEWRVIDASTYGFPQRRKRVFMIGSMGGTKGLDHLEVIESGIMSSAFPISVTSQPLKTELEGSLIDITNKFNHASSKSPFLDAGFMSDRIATSVSCSASYDGPYLTLKDVLLPLEEIPDEFFIDSKDLDKWVYLKGAKNEARKKGNGELFYYKEGAVGFPEPLDKAARTIITSEGGKTPSRFKLVVNQEGKIRRLTPIELERLNMFPDLHTEGYPDARRAFFMGNALVVGVIELLGKSLSRFNGY